jgi:hypothetical protein
MEFRNHPNDRETIDKWYKVGLASADSGEEVYPILARDIIRDDNADHLFQSEPF